MTLAASMVAVTPAQALRPQAPSASQFMWQGQQTAFTTANGTSCPATVGVAIAMGDQAVCYAAPDDTLRCAGRIYNTVYGSIFTAAGQVGVEQIFLSPTANSGTGNAICVKKSDGTAACMGDYNAWNQFGTGVSGPSATFVQWGTQTNLVRLGTGTWDQFCAIDATGIVSCTGNGFGGTPVVQDGGATHDRFWVSTFGTVQLDDPNVFRAASGRAECRIGATGLVCPTISPTEFPPSFGAAVEGTIVESVPLSDDACWLDPSGDVQCFVRGHLFAPHRTIALAANAYTDSLCAVYDDGSLWCVGSNEQGKLGTGDTQPLSVETQVLPPGSVRVPTTCGAYGDGVIDAGEACDDDNVIEGDGCDSAGQVEPCFQCSGTPSTCTMTPGAPCDDGLFCDGTEICNAAGQCESSGDPCPDTQCNTCQEALDSCFDPPGTSCDDASVCTTGDACSAGTCAGTTVPDGTTCDDHFLCTSSDACEAGVCHGTQADCGDGIVQIGCEACDDANANASDGCDRCVLAPLAVLEPSAVPGVPVTTDTGSGATPSQPLQATVTIPNAGNTGAVAITVAPTTSNPSTSSYYLGAETQITAPTQSPTAPLTFAFILDASLVPPDESAGTLQLFRNGTAVPDCLGATQAVPDDPCITSRTLLGNGDVQLVALTSAASTWNLGAAPCPVSPRTGCRQPTASEKAQLQIKDTTPSSKNLLKWKWGSGAATSVDAFGDPRTWPAYTLCVYDTQSSTPHLLLSAPAPAGGTCNGKACWAAAGASGFKYKNKAATPAGVAAMTLKAGADGKATVTVKAQGALLALGAPPLSVSLPVTVQLSAQNGQCWTATYDTATKNDGTQLKAKSN